MGGSGRRTAGYQAARRVARCDLHHRQQRQERPRGRADAAPDGGLGGPRGTLAAARQRRPEPGVPDSRHPDRGAVLAVARPLANVMQSLYYYLLLAAYNCLLTFTLWRASVQTWHSPGPVVAPGVVPRGGATSGKPMPAAGETAHVRRLLVD